MSVSACRVVIRRHELLLAPLRLSNWRSSACHRPGRGEQLPVPIPPRLFNRQERASPAPLRGISRGAASRRPRQLDSTLVRELRGDVPPGQDGRCGMMGTWASNSWAHLLLSTWVPRSQGRQAASRRRLGSCRPFPARTEQRSRTVQRPDLRGSLTSQTGQAGVHADGAACPSAGEADEAAGCGRG